MSFQYVMSANRDVAPDSRESGSRRQIGTHRAHPMRMAHSSRPRSVSNERAKLSAPRVPHELGKWRVYWFCCLRQASGEIPTIRLNVVVK